MRKFLPLKINTVFIMLGFSCNLNCGYCLQKAIVEVAPKQEINSQIYDFLEQVVTETKATVHIQFFGGEPLLYWNEIKEIVQELEERQLDVSFGIISNGKALTDEMVKFINARYPKFNFTLSWDGQNTIYTRHWDFFKFPDLKYRFMALKQAGISSVFTKFSYPLEVAVAVQELSDEYYKIHKYYLRANLDTLLDTGFPDRELLKMDFDRVETEFEQIMEFYFACKLGKQTAIGHDSVKVQYAYKILAPIFMYYKHPENKLKPRVYCGNGYSTLNLDLKGNLYDCHNAANICGRIDSNYTDYLCNVVDKDTTRYNLEKCQDCVALAYCRGGCKLMSQEVRDNYYCFLKRAMVTPALKILQAIGENLTNETKE